MLDDCSSAATTDGGFVSSLTCNAKNAVKSIINSTKAAGDILMYNIMSFVTSVFPFNVFSHISADFDAAKAGNSSPDITLTSDDPNNFFYGANFVLLSSSTIGEVYEDTSFNLRTFLTYGIYALLGYIMIAASIATAQSLKNKQ